MGRGAGAVPPIPAPPRSPGQTASDEFHAAAFWFSVGAVAHGVLRGARGPWVSPSETSLGLDVRRSKTPAQDSLGTCPDLDARTYYLSIPVKKSGPTRSATGRLHLDSWQDRNQRPGGTRDDHHPPHHRQPAPPRRHR